MALLLQQCDLLIDACDTLALVYKLFTDVFYRDTLLAAAMLRQIHKPKLALSDASKILEVLLPQLA